MNTWTCVVNENKRWLVRGNKTHGGVDLGNPDVVSPHVSFMLLNHPTTGSILHLGLGAGEIPRYLSRFPVVQTAIEISDDVLSLAQNFNLPKDLEIIHTDAVDFVARTPKHFNMVYLDISASPGAVSTYDFFKGISKITKKMVANFFGTDQMQALRRLEKYFMCKTHVIGPNLVVQASNI